MAVGRGRAAVGDLPNFDPFMRDGGGVPVGLTGLPDGVTSWAIEFLMGQGLGVLVKGLSALL